MDGGFVAVHWRTGRQVRAGTRRGLRVAELRTGLVTGRWMEFMRRIWVEFTGYVGPENDRKWCEAHGVPWHRERPVDDHPVGVGRV